MSTLVEGTVNLSSQVRFNQYLDDLVKQSNKQKAAGMLGMQGKSRCRT
ncbi:MAG: hypothetical protein CM15mV77_060 [uncultured marine virus]|nr:MAG: hypothetical protein CM15mV77_060 [uncultured marine virus]